MRCPTVLLMLLVIHGFLSPPGARAQNPRDPPALPAMGFKLEQNQPNPVTRDTWIPFALEESLFANGETRTVSIQIFNLLNQVVAVPRAPDHARGKNLPVTNLPYSEPGRKVAYWDGKDHAGRRVPSGVYYCQLVVGDQTQMRKMIVVSPRRNRKLFPWFGTRNRPE